MEIDKKIENIEIKIAYLEDYADKLNSVIMDQQKEIENLRTALENIKPDSTDDFEEIKGQEKPPHY